ncbi:hypothetical protein [Microvirga roseola]|uniref:hypothetical protein n=1 Tax=Microvirga roseola TaxID=2883126 RepID=UPI001E5144BD|nr:hypothetical protein [Microvirga roseola]
MLSTDSIWFERVWPWAGAAVAVLVWWYFGAPFPQSADGLFGASATVASVFASFLGVAQAIILTIKGTETFKRLEKLDYIDSLFGYLRTAILAAVVFASLSIIGFFLDRNVFSGHWIIVFPGGWIGAGALALLTYARVSNILFKLLRRV